MSKNKKNLHAGEYEEKEKGAQEEILQELTDAQKIIKEKLHKAIHAAHEKPEKNIKRDEV